MLIVVPPSESKRPPPDHGSPVDLDALSFPRAQPRRGRRSSTPSSRPVPGPTRSADCKSARRRRPRSRATPGSASCRPCPRSTSTRGRSTRAWMPARCRRRRPSGPSAASSSRPRCGALLRPADRIPPYRLHICSRLVGMDRLEPTWRTVLGEPLRRSSGLRRARRSTCGRRATRRWACRAVSAIEPSRCGSTRSRRRRPTHRRRHREAHPGAGGSPAPRRRATSPTVLARSPGSSPSAGRCDSRSRSGRASPGR